MNERICLDQWLADDATQGLPPWQRQELEQLLTEIGVDAENELEAFHRTAFLVEMAFGYRESELPAELEKRLLASARGFADQDETVHEGAPAADVISLAPRRPVASRRIAWGWAAAAAALLLAVAGWWPRVVPTPGAPVPVAQEAAQPTPAPGPTDLMVADFSATEDPAAAGATGTLEWSPESQVGWMHFEGLAANDPTEYQYQLWIFDQARDERFPVDGGVFDIDRTTGVVDVRIDPKLPVDRATLFAVTVEPPGGVVVSDRERIVMVAQIG